MLTPYSIESLPPTEQERLSECQLFHLTRHPNGVTLVPLTACGETLLLALYLTYPVTLTYSAAAVLLSEIFEEEN